jgi:signal transduction histidine kinase
MRPRLEVAGRTVQRIAQLVDGLLVFAIGGAPPPLEARADVQEVLSGIIEGMLPQAAESNIDLHAEPATKLTAAPWGWREILQEGARFSVQLPRAAIGARPIR